MHDPARGGATEIVDDRIGELVGGGGNIGPDIDGDGFAIFEGDENGVFDHGGGDEFPEMAEHHDGGEDHGGGVGDVFAGDGGGGAMDGLENFDGVSDVGGGGEAEAAGETGGEVGDDIAVHIGSDNDFELLGEADQLVGAVVDDDVLRVDVGVIGGDFFEGAFEQPFGEFHDVGLGGAVDASAAFGTGEFEGEADDFFTALAGHEFEALGDAGGLHVFDAGVKVFDIFTDDDEIDAMAAKGGGYAGEFASGADIRIEFEHHAEGDIGALFAVADGGGEGAFEGKAISFYGFDGFPGDTGGVAGLKYFFSGKATLPSDIDAGGFDDADGCFGDFGADAIAGDEGDGSGYGFGIFSGHWPMIAD